jgi:hypothetical protein
LGDDRKKSIRSYSAILVFYTRRDDLNIFVKVLVTIGSSASIGFGIWHFFVPKAWNWYSYIDSNATELVAAVRAINAFFSLSLILFGILNILLIYGDRSNRYSIIVMLAATCILWLTRVTFQVIYPQGSLVPGLQYGMLSAFVLIGLCYLISLLNALFQAHFSTEVLTTFLIKIVANLTE